MMLVEVDRSDEPRFLVRGVPTKDIADDIIIELKGTWKVTGTGPYTSARFGKKTYFIVEPLKKRPTGVKPIKSNITLTARAPKTWNLVEAKPGAPFLERGDLTITKLPKEMEGGTLLVRDHGSQPSWLVPGTLAASKDVTVYVTLLASWQGKPTVNESTLTAFAKDGWTELKPPVGTTSPEGETWQLRTFKKNLNKGPVSLELRGVTWPRQMTFFVFK
jgi:hypothetical protein